MEVCAFILGLAAGLAVIASVEMLNQQTGGELQW